MLQIKSDCGNCMGVGHEPRTSSVSPSRRERGVVVGQLPGHRGRKRDAGARAGDGAGTGRD
jgi:hypothetical protein